MLPTRDEVLAAKARAETWFEENIQALEKRPHKPKDKPRTAHREAILEDELTCRMIEALVEKRRKHWRFFYEPMADGRWLATYFKLGPKPKTADEREAKRQYKREWRAQKRNQEMQREHKRRAALRGTGLCKPRTYRSDGL